MGEKLRALPIGTYDFEKLRRRGHLYVDKTQRLQELITAGDWYFLSRPRRFGKSLTLSTLEAMFSGKAELFKGLAAEAWVADQARHPCPVLCLSTARGRPTEDIRGGDINPGQHRQREDGRDLPGLFAKPLSQLYLSLKDYDSHLRFVMLTGISKFSKTGVFSAMNNLNDISMNRRYGGCSQAAGERA